MTLIHKMYSEIRIIIDHRCHEQTLTKIISMFIIYLLLKSGINHFKPLKVNKKAYCFPSKNY